MFMKKTTLFKILGSIAFLSVFVLNAMLTVEKGGGSSLLSLSSLKAWAIADESEGPGGGGTTQSALREVVYGIRHEMFWDEINSRWCTWEYPTTTVNCYGQGTVYCDPSYTEDLRTGPHC